MKNITKILSLSLICLTSSTFAMNKTSTISAKNHSQLFTGDAEIIGFYKVLNKNELVLAALVLEKNVSEKVKGYAEHMKKDHTKNLQQINKVSEEIQIEARRTPKVDALKKKGKKALHALQAVNSVKFEKAYMKDMVAGHAEALKKTDHYLKTVHNKVLKKYLLKTRPAIAMHLEKAKAIQNQLDN